MKSIVRKWLCCVLIGAICFGYAPAVNAEPATAALYHVYGDNMLFNEKQEAVLSGAATPGSKITCELADDAGVIQTTAAAQTNRSGIFRVRLPIPGAFLSKTFCATS